MVTGSDGYDAVFGLAERDPDFGAEVVLEASMRDDQPLGQPGVRQPRDTLVESAESLVPEVEAGPLRALYSKLSGSLSIGP